MWITLEFEEVDRYIQEVNVMIYKIQERETLFWETLTLVKF